MSLHLIVLYASTRLESHILWLENTGWLSCINKQNFQFSNLTEVKK